MATPDLPLEVWLLILSYLGPADAKAFRRMIGVNRNFFELGMNSLYETMRLEAGDANTIRRFTQLKHSNISRRVRYLLIDPLFLPKSSWSYERSVPVIPQKPAIFRYQLLSLVNEVKAAISVDLIGDILYAAKRGIKSCNNLREIQVTLHDRVMTPAFLDFASSVWSNKLVAQSLEKIKISTTTPRLPVLLKPITAHAHNLTNLLECDISFLSTAHIPTPEENRSVTVPLQCFLQAMETIGTQVTSSTVLEIRGDVLRASAPPLPTINNQVLSLHFLNATLSGSSKTVPFVNVQAHSVKQLNLRSIYWNSEIDPWGYVDQSCAGFVLSEGKDRFEALRLPFLENLHITIERWGPGLGRLSQYLGQKHPFFSTLPVVAPRLKSLTLLGPYFADVQADIFLTLIADGYDRHGQSGSIQHFEFTCNKLTAEMCILLSSRMAYLTSLVIHQRDLGAIARDQTTSSFFGITECPRFDDWRLEHLRITKRKVQLDDEDKCVCGNGNWRLS
ncbi:hypothetical protein BJ165DRAFT_1497365 [Panaeolus papilionaceus]|nr:hypothetical protein BJ165DRAFT_1497365 [Panaeolus papilionaceus]